VLFRHARLCYKNGSLSRERVRDEHFGGSWESFNASFDTSSAPAAGIQGQVTVFSFDKPEILPSGVSGVHVFRDGAYLAGGEADLTAEERASLARRVVESQFMSFRKRVTGILKDGGQLRRIFVAGGGSVKYGLDAWIMLQGRLVLTS
jgi:xylulokinase